MVPFWEEFDREYLMYKVMTARPLGTLLEMKSITHACIRLVGQVVAWRPHRGC